MKLFERIRVATEFGQSEKTQTTTGAVLARRES